MTEVSESSANDGISRRLILGSAAGVASAILIPSGVAQAMPQRPRILKFSDHEPLGGMRTRFLKDVVFPAIERESHGRLKIEDHWNGEVVGPYDALRAVGTAGVTDLATVVPEYTPDQLPLHQIFKGFPVGPTGGRQIDFFQRVYADVPAFSMELDKNNVVNLYFGTGYPVAFLSAPPLPNLDALAGATWRTASFWHRDFLRNAGATPVTIPWGQGVFDALAAGTLDGVVVNVDSGYMLNAHTAAPNVLVSKDLWLGHVYLLAINKEVWIGLPQRDKEAIQRAATRSYQTIGSVMDTSFDTQLEDLRRAGANVRVLGSDELSRWQTVTRYREVQATWVEEQKAKGNTKAGPTLARVTSLMSGFVR